MAAKLGDFFVNISTKSDNKGIKEVSTGLDDLLGKAKKLAAAYLSFQAVKGLVNADREIIKDAAELGRLSDTLGVATEDLEQFGRAFEIVGAGVDSAYSTINALIKLSKDFKFGRISDETFIALQQLHVNTAEFTDDAVHNFDIIRKGAQQATAEERNYFANAIGLGEKSLRVLRLTDKEWQNIYEIQAKEAPLLNQEQKGKAESYARMEARVGIAKDALLRKGAIATAPTLEKGAEKILNGAKFIDATFSDSKEEGKNKSKNVTIGDMFTSPKLNYFTGGALGKGIDKISEFFEENKKLFRGETSQRNDRKGLMPSDARNREIERQIPKGWDGSKSIIINNNFQNKTDVQIKDARNLEKDFAQHIPSIIDEVYSKSMKQASENFKSGVIQ